MNPIEEFVQNYGGVIGLFAALILIIKTLVTYISSKYKDERQDKKDKQKDIAIIVADERVKKVEEKEERSSELYEKFIEDYKDLSNKFLENSKEVVAAMQGHTHALTSLETIQSQSLKINEKLSESVDRLRDTIIENLIKITK